MPDQLTLYFTSDTHGYVYPTHFMDSALRPMGLLSMTFPKDGNTLVIDGGDTLQGSPLTYYCHTQGKPMPMAAVMNDLGYDFVTLGNHDFNYGQEPLREHLQTLNAQCLCANVQDDRGRLPIAGTAVRTLENGLRVGLVGITTDWVKLWEKPEHLTGLSIGDPFAAAAKAVGELRDQVDVLIGLYHGGFEKDTLTGQRLSETDENIGCRLCEMLPLDVLLTGHQHIALVNRTYHGTHIVQPPCNAAAFIRVRMDENGLFTSELITPEPTQAWKPWEHELFTELNEWLDRPIGKLSRPIWPEGKLPMAMHGSPIAAFFNQVQRQAGGADISCTALGNELRGLDSRVTVRDVVASYTYSNTLVVLSVTGAVLKAALEQCATYFDVEPDGRVRIAKPFMQPKQAHYNYDYFDGIHYTFDLRMPLGERVTEVTRDGKPVREEERFTLVMNNYRATGAGDFSCYLECPRVREIQTEISELILDYLRTHALVEIPEQSSYSVILPNGGLAEDEHFTPDE